MTAGLRLEGVSVRIGAREVMPLTDLDAPPGSSVAVLGGAQAGKTTVLEVLSGGRPPSTGRVRFEDRGVDPDRVGRVTQRYDLLGGLTPVENLAVRAFALGRPDAGDQEEAEAHLRDLLLPESTWHNLVEQLSGGQQQRVAVARALMGAPGLLCLDAPTSELDEATADAVHARLLVARRTGAIVVLTTTDPAEAARCDAILALRPATE